MQQRKRIEQQNADLQRKAAAHPMGMSSLLATLLSMKITGLLLREDFEERARSDETRLD